jgi:hypothetical protein
MGPAVSHGVSASPDDTASNQYLAVERSSRVEKERSCWQIAGFQARYLKLPVGSNYSNALKDEASMMVRFDEEYASGALVGLRYRHGEPAASAPE